MTVLTASSLVSVRYHFRASLKFDLEQFICLSHGHGARSRFESAHVAGCPLTNGFNAEHVKALEKQLGVVGSARLLLAPSRSRILEMYLCIGTFWNYHRIKYVCAVTKTVCGQHKRALAFVFLSNQPLDTDLFPISRESCIVRGIIYSAWKHKLPSPKWRQTISKSSIDIF
jgi:hypothetical protein